MKYEALIEEFINAFPEFSETAKRDRKWWEGDNGEQPLVHVFFGDILNKFLVLNCRKIRRKTPKKLFMFLIRWLFLRPRVRAVLSDTILEYLGDDKEILKRAMCSNGKTTLKFSHDVEKSWEGNSMHFKAATVANSKLK
jgi:hypothetical protein